MQTPKNDLDRLEVELGLNRQKGLTREKDKKFSTKDIRNFRLVRLQQQQNNDKVSNPEYVPDLVKDISAAEVHNYGTQQFLDSLEVVNNENLALQQEYEDVLDFHEYVATGDISYDSGIETGIAEYAQQAQLGPDGGEVDLTRIANVESGNNYSAKNPNSSAYGKYQFIDSTRNEIAKRKGIQDPLSPEGQEKVMESYTKSNINKLKNKGYPVNTLTVYALHQQGQQGGIELLNGNLSPKVEENVIANTPAKYRTGNPVQDWFTYYSKKLM